MIVMQLLEKDVGKTKLRKVTAYIDPVIYEEYEKLAKLEMRTVSSLTAVAIVQLLDKAKVEGKI
ncbi:hypothetical protein NIES2119_31650 [[Phormidium ambiguum] IAM M-71]|uniref:CopG-like ribbon-helix-helix domain-containing protein n=2 Tax=[Phormidium ambiguum] IAM M-71 TaxID=454136 RepID=A0A1U7I251_9CYAN|nr:hypothetical protein NIES2119_31650 [Phormidium ambiguum IAM M-71]